MKPVKNKQIRKKKYVRTPNIYTRYKCTNCGAMDEGVAYWSETRYGSASLLNLDGELGDFDDSDSDNFEINEYRCLSCDMESSSASDIFVACDEDGNEEE